MLQLDCVLRRIEKNKILVENYFIKCNNKRYTLNILRIFSRIASDFLFIRHKSLIIINTRL